MNREELQKEFVESLERLNFKRTNSLDSRIGSYIKNGKILSSRDEVHAEVNIDYYGFTIMVISAMNKRYKKIFSWENWGSKSAADAFLYVLDYWGLADKK